MTIKTFYRRGDYVQTWFDTGALGATQLYGVVIAAGPRAFRVRWESGLTNRLRQDNAGGVKRITRDDVDTSSIARLDTGHFVGQGCTCHDCE